MVAAGASYAARGTVNNPVQLTNFITEGISHKGFSAIEVISQCPVHFARLNGMRSPVAELNWIKENSITQKQAEGLSYEERLRKFVIGKFVDREQEDLGTKYAKIQEIASKEAE